MLGYMLYLFDFGNVVNFIQILQFLFKSDFIEIILYGVNIIRICHGIECTKVSFQY